MVSIFCYSFIQLCYVYIWKITNMHEVETATSRGEGNGCDRQLGVHVPGKSQCNRNKRLCKETAAYKTTSPFGSLATIVIILYSAATYIARSTKLMMMIMNLSWTFAWSSLVVWKKKRIYYCTLLILGKAERSKKNKRKQPAI
jgi:hypothetical protein